MNLKQKIHKAAVEFSFAADKHEHKHAEDAAIMAKFAELKFAPEDYEYFKTEYKQRRAQFEQLANLETESERKAKTAKAAK